MMKNLGKLGFRSVQLFLLFFTCLSSTSILCFAKSIDFFYFSVMSNTTRIVLETKLQLIFRYNDFAFLLVDFTCVLDGALSF